jgi:hypothetical protein
MSPEFLSKSALFASLVGINEKVVESDLLGGAVLIRELTARQRLIAREAATKDTEDEPDNALYYAMLIQFCVVDPETGVAGPDGTVDPHTRAPLFTPQELAVLAEGRASAVQLLVEQITSLSAMSPVSLRQGDQASERGERGPRQGHRAGGAAAGGAADQGTGDDDERAARPAEIGEGVGAPA